MVRYREDVEGADGIRDAIIDDRGYHYNPYKPNMGLSDAELEILRKLEAEQGSQPERGSGEDGLHGPR